MIPKVEAYHKRKLSDKFFCVYLDATYLPLRRETFEREAVYIAIGIKPNGHKEVIDYCIAPSENIEVWTDMLQNMQGGSKAIFGAIMGAMAAFDFGGPVWFMSCAISALKYASTIVKRS